MAIITNAVVEKVVNISDDIKEYILKPEKMIAYEPGQFLQLSLDIVDASDYWAESRTFSIASYGKDYLRLIIKKVGQYTTRIFNELSSGSVVTIKYAYGDFLLPFDYDDGIVCIAGGTGISPILSFVDKLEEDGDIDKIKLFYSAKTKSSLIDFERLCNILEKENLHFYLTREKTNDKNINFGRINIEEISRNLNKNSYFYICGSNDFISYFKSNLEKLGFESIVLDEWE